MYTNDDTVRVNTNKKNENKVNNGMSTTTKAGIAGAAGIAAVGGVATAAYISDSDADETAAVIPEDQVPEEVAAAAQQEVHQAENNHPQPTPDPEPTTTSEPEPAPTDEPAPEPKPEIVPESQPEPEVHVIAVEDNVEMDGELVDVAAVTYEDTPILLFDTNQDGEVNVMAADVNQNGTFEDNEVADVTDDHVIMPTEADVDGGSYECGSSDDVAEESSSEELPDYSNDADITTYEI